MQDRYMEWGSSAHHGDSMREQRSGLQGLGGRPRLHPAWSDAAKTASFGLLGAAAHAVAGSFEPQGDKNAYAS